MTERYKITDPSWGPTFGEGLNSSQQSNGKRKRTRTSPLNSWYAVGGQPNFKPIPGEEVEIKPTAKQNVRTTPPYSWLSWYPETNSAYDSQEQGGDEQGGDNVLEPPEPMTKKIRECKEDTGLIDTIADEKLKDQDYETKLLAVLQSGSSPLKELESATPSA